MSSIKTFKKFIERSIFAHGNKYLYDKTIYTDSRSEVIIICKTHGDFTQIANTHSCKKEYNKCINKNEAKCMDILENYSGYKFIKIRPKFLNGLELALEYNGEQHYKAIEYFERDTDSLELQQIRDELKQQLCDDNDIYLIIVPYWIKNKKKYIEDEYDNYEFITNYNDY